MPRAFTLALGQMRIEEGKVEENFRRAQALADRAARLGADLLLLPELWPTGYVLEQGEALAARPGEGAHQAMGELARQAGLWLAGSLLLRVAGGVANALCLFDPQGRERARYLKIHLFPPMDEDRYLVAGSEPVLADLPWGRAGLAICYDLRFPELFRRYVEAGAELFLVPAEWPAPRRDHWDLLGRARAVENLAFLAACNRVGDGFAGGSAVYDPWGTPLVRAEGEEVLLTVRVDLDRVVERRREFPALEHRRPDVYGKAPLTASTE